MNTKSLIVLIALALVVVVGATVFLFYPANKPVVGATSAKDATYNIEGVSVTLTNGTSVVPIAPGSASKITTQYFGNEVSADLNGDGRTDTAFILTQNTGGSGTFYYVVAALNMAGGYVGSQGFFIGDRIAPQTTELRANNIIVVNYADRAAGESFAVQPSVGKSLFLKLDPVTMQFGEVVQNFEGEANPSTMKLNMQTWTWKQTVYNNNTIVTPKKPNAFTLTLKDDGSFSATTDCNGVGGDYSISGSKISFSKMMSTLMFCEGSQEQDYTKMLNQIQSYHFTSKGELVFDLQMDSGSMIFR